ncbi:MAG TPA: hypothetical protein VFD43_07175 [Planctomycetota bacterium]|nr:hypothetical protein [Planctomycetota bacterium]
MKRALLWTLLGVAVVAITLVALVGVRAGEVEPLPPADPALPIDLPGGERLPLAEVVDRARRGLPLPVPEPLLPSEQTSAAELAAATLERRAAAGVVVPAGAAPFVDPDPLFALADTAHREGRLEQAMALYLSVPPDDDRYSRARRIVAWKILTRDLDRPEQAVALANQSLHADPFDGNVWQDWARVYGSALGLPVD